MHPIRYYQLLLYTTFFLLHRITFPFTYGESYPYELIKLVSNLGCTLVRPGLYDRPTGVVRPSDPGWTLKTSKYKYNCDPVELQLVAWLCCSYTLPVYFTLFKSDEYHESL